MSLSDLMSAAGLHQYAEVGLIAFMIAFALVLWRIFAPRNRDLYERAGRMPLDDDSIQTPRAKGH